MSAASSKPVYDSAQKGSAALQELREIFKYRYLVSQLVRRDLLTRYKRSVLGVAWTMLNPLGTMLVLTFVFSHAFGGQIKGYPAFVLSGLAAWNFFSQTTNAATLHLVWGGSLLKRIYIPRTVFAVSSAGTGLVNLLLSLAPLVIIMLVIGVPLRPAFLLVPIPILFLTLFSLGVGLLISAIAVYFADIAEMYQIALTAWMYLTPVIYPLNIIPDVYRVWIVRLNPMNSLISLFRATVFEGRVPSLSEFLVAGGISLIVFLVGWWFFTKRADEFAYRI